jgi:hypothetical protein
VDSVVDSLESRHPGEERAAGELNHLQRADDAPPVAGQDRGSRLRVLVGQSAVQLMRPGGGEFRIEPPADLRGLAGELEPIQRGANVQPRAADQDRDAAAGPDVLDRPACHRLVLRHRRRFRDGPDVE